MRVPGVLDDGHDVHALLGHVDEIAAGAVRELHCVDHALLEIVIVIIQLSVTVLMYFKILKV